MVAVTAPRFLIPSLLWYGPAPPVDQPRRGASVPDLTDGGWGGLVASEDIVTQLLLALDPVTVLLSLAGYANPEIVLGIPSVAAETPEADLISIDLASMSIGRGPAHAWVPASGAVAQVAVWVEPQDPSGRPAVAAGTTLDLSATGTAFADDSISLEFAQSGTGWLRFAWPAGDVSLAAVDRLAGLVAALRDALITELDRQYVAAQDAASEDTDPPVCGLVGLYDPRSWSVPLSVSGTLPSGVETFGDRVRELVDTGTGIGVGELLQGDLDEPPMAAADRWAQSVIDSDLQVVVDDLSICVDELVDQALRGGVPDPDQAQTFAGCAYRAMAELPLTALLLYWQQLGVLLFMPSAPSVVAELYGGYVLRRDDDDATLTYEGAVRTTTKNGDPLPTTGYIAQLRAHLTELGFGPLIDPPADTAAPLKFDVWVERAVREVQLYARSPSLAQEATTGDFYGARLAQVANPVAYQGPVSGVANAETQGVIAAWRESSLRCPVVIEFRPPKSDSPALDPTLVHPENVWRADQIKAASVATGRFYARDLSGSRVLGDESKKRKRALDSIVLGHWSNVFAPNGPAAIPPSEVWGEYEVTPDVVAAAFDAMTPAQRSTFRAVRPTAEVECFGYFDVFNAVDTAFFSMGLCHWTIGLSGSRGTTDAELPPYFAYLKGLGSGPELGAYNAAFGNYGCGVTKEWPKGTTGPSAPAWEPKQRKYTAWVTFESESGTPVEAPRAGNDSAEWFRQWHWCYRFVMAARTLPVFRQRMWDYARIRLRDLLQTPWQPELAVQDHAGTRPATIGDLFTCERSVAMLLRWHVNHPSQLLPITQTSRLSLAFNAAGAAEWGDVNQWTDANEAALCDALFAQRPAYPDVLHCTLDVVYHWPDLATSPSCKKAAEKGDRKQWGWKLDAPSVLNTPRISGLANAGGAAGAAFVHDFTVDLRDVISRSPITASSSDQSIVPDRNITVVAGTPPSYRLSATPLSGASGTTVITVSADNGAHVSKVAFFLTVGGPPGSTPPPAPTGTTTGLSTRRHSFLLDSSGLP